MKSERKVKIELGMLQEIALKGVRRAAVFMGLGVNAAQDPSFKKYQLAHLTGIELVPTNVDDTTLQHFKDEFEIWIVGCGLRELTESFGTFLDAIHNVCSLLEANRNRITQEDAESRQRNFTWKGIGDKLKALKNRFRVAPSRPDCLCSINQARNCLTHRQGRVAAEDCRGDEHFTMKWFSFDLFADEAGKKEPTLLPLPFPDSGVVLQAPPGGGAIRIKGVERTLKVDRGDLIRLSPKDLAEICHFIVISSKDVCESTAQYAKSIGAVSER